jgi:DNA-binding NtrC family response regulator
MKKKILILAHNDDTFLEEVLACLGELDLDIQTENRCPADTGIPFDYKPDAVIVNVTSLLQEKCIQHIKDLSRETLVLVAERDSTVESYIRMQVLGVREYFHVPLDSKNLQNAVIELLKLC